MMDRHDTVGIDCVAMCVNDVLCQGATPLFFLDYIATGKVTAEKIADIVKGVAEGCLQGNSALVGGETAEMPGFYGEGEYDMDKTRANYYNYHTGQVWGDYHNYDLSINSSKISEDGAVQLILDYIELRS